MWSLKNLRNIYFTFKGLMNFVLYLPRKEKEKYISIWEYLNVSTRFFSNKEKNKFLKP